MPKESDRELLIRIDERVNTLSQNSVNQDELEACKVFATTEANKSVVTHERKLHKGVSWALIGQIMTTMALAGLALWKMLG